MLYEDNFNCLSKMCLRMRAAMIARLSVPLQLVREADRRLGFIRRGAFDVQFVPLASELPRAALRDPQRWHIAGGDFDVV
jgi:hypothetical protein